MKTNIGWSLHARANKHEIQYPRFQAVEIEREKQSISATKRLLDGAAPMVLVPCSAPLCAALQHEAFPCYD
jgi:hypothetical protein